MPKLFFSYSHKDESFRDQLEVHLSALKRQKAIESWHDRKIVAGSSVDDTINQHLDEAEVILLLISPDFIASDYCYDREVQRALQRHSEGSTRVIPVILRPCDWHELPFGKLLAAPTDGRAISTWANQDEAFLDVVRHIRSALGRAASPSRGPAPATSATTTAPSRTLPKTAREHEEGQDSIHYKQPPRSPGGAQPGDPNRSESRALAKAAPAQPSVGIDIGTRYTKIYVEGRGIALDEPSAVSVEPSTRKITGVGAAALEIAGEHGRSFLIRPLVESVIGDPDAAFHMLKHFLRALGVPDGSRAVFAVPEAATTASLAVLFEIARRAGAGRVEFMRRTLLAAASSGAPTGQINNGTVVEIGAGTTDVTVLSESRAYCSRFVRFGGNHVDEAITRFMKRAYSQLIGERTAELIKIQLGSAWQLGERLSMEAKGRNLIEGRARATALTDRDVRATIQECIEPLVSAIREALDRTPASALSGGAEDIVVLSGGSALIRGIAEFLQDRLHARVLTRNEPRLSVASGFASLFNGDWKPPEPLAYPPRKLRPGPG